MNMGSNNLYSTSAKYYTQNGAPPLVSCGISSAEKGIAVACSGLADTPERMNLWYLRAPGESATEYLYFKDMVDIRTCALNEGAAQNAVRLTGVNGELYLLEIKTAVLAQKLADRLNTVAQEYLAANRERAQNLQLPERVVIPTADPKTKTEMTEEMRKGKTLQILSLVLQTIGYLLLLMMFGALINDRGNTDFTGIGFAALAAVGCIVVGVALKKKSLKY
jgi:hypothetical protein